ncbi:DinB family protein [Paenibacillus cellulosilyticus]|uniref:DinB family protein n=1 Tax=Paenibacillus cellulosilyticus TaxID=375489 RepID=A0A2V2YP81_9BACL|nr:putative metal-dependent hydrolase [Paenibacillus cellulosilyticus]PWV94517.1 DinB family protein [Paenibacillus cellulosilyticus]QKS45025.1 putative metal-dependent hydrolase [Paenibacillus cellulosilyticus]
MIVVDALRYPIGQFEPNLAPTLQDRRQLIHQIAGLTDELRDLVRDLTPEQLKVPYRPEGWCIQQIIHHLADNDTNACLRLRRALTEDQPAASSYREDLFAELSDYSDAPIELSITLLEALHKRLVILLSRLSEDQFQRKLQTGLLGIITIDTAVQRLVWHNRHHMAQIQLLIERKGWRTN